MASERKTIAVIVDEELFEFLENLRWAEHQTRAEFMRKALTEFAESKGFKAGV